MAGSNLEEGKENVGNEFEDRKLTELENCVLGVEVNELDNEQEYLLGGGRFALEEEIKNGWEGGCGKDD